MARSSRDRATLEDGMKAQKYHKTFTINTFLACFSSFSTGSCSAAAGSSSSVLSKSDSNTSSSSICFYIL